MKTIWGPYNINSLEARPTSGCIFWEERTSEKQCQLWVVESAAEHEG